MWKLLTCFMLLGCFERYVSYTGIPKSVLVFVENGLVPDVLVTPPATLLHVSFPSGAVADGGNEIPLGQVLQQPELTWDAELGRFYTVIFLDPDVSSRDNAQYRSFLHWLVVNVPGNDIRNGETLANFINSQPRAGTGLHRYVFLVYEQPSWINFQGLPDYMDLIKRARFQAEEFSRRFNLGIPMAGNLYQSKNYSTSV